MKRFSKKQGQVTERDNILWMNVGPVVKRKIYAESLIFWSVLFILYAATLYIAVTTLR